MPVQIMMHRLVKDIPEPRCAYEGTSAAFDLACAKTTTIQPGEFKSVPTGILLSIPDDQPYYMQVHLRSSLGFKKGLRCHIGIIDAGYTGDFGVSVVNNTDKPVTIEKGDFFAQVLTIRKPEIEIVELPEAEWEVYKTTQARGDGGFGSSGK